MKFTQKSSNDHFYMKCKEITDDRMPMIFQNLKSLRKRKLRKRKQIRQFYQPKWKSIKVFDIYNLTFTLKITNEEWLDLLKTPAISNRFSLHRECLAFWRTLHQLRPWTHKKSSKTYKNPALRNKRSDVKSNWYKEKGFSYLLRTTQIKSNFSINKRRRLLIC